MFLELCEGVLLFASCSSYLCDSSCEDLCYGVEVTLAFGDGGEELVRIVVVISAFEDVDDCSSEAGDLLGSDSCGFDPIHCPRIDFGKDDPGLGLGGRWAVPESLELLLRPLPSLIKGAAVCVFPSGQVGSEVSKIADNLDAAVDQFPVRVSKPLPDLVGTCKVVALIGATFAPILCR